MRVVDPRRWDGRSEARRTASSRASRAGRPDGHRQHRRRRRAPRPPGHARPRLGPVHARRPVRRRARLGRRRRDMGRRWTGSSATARKPGSASAIATSRPTSPGPTQLRAGAPLTDAVLALQARPRDRDARSCRWPTSRSGRRSGPTRAGSSSRSTSSAATRCPRCSRSGTPASRPRARPTRSSRRSSEADVHRHRAIEPDRLARARSWRSRPWPSHRRARVRGVPVVAVSGIVGGKALKGPADRMLDVARPRVERHGRRRDPGAVRSTPSSSTGSMPRWSRRSPTLGLRDVRDRHDHGRRRGSRATGRAVLDFAVPPPDEDESVPSEA